ncbi:MAG: hypothetical protein LKJ86_03610 [Oscillibacter sp.]|jgi:hypothetical protein|nr:hypothetical protein [Oscillibacter sp.]
MEIAKSKVYIQTDVDGRVTRCEGGYTTPSDLTGWTYIDEGIGDRYHLCQSHYFDGGLYTTDGICRWQYNDGACHLRTNEEIVADQAARPTSISVENVTLEMLADHEERICMMELMSA